MGNSLSIWIYDVKVTDLPPCQGTPVTLASAIPVVGKMTTLPSIPVRSVILTSVPVLSFAIRV